MATPINEAKPDSQLNPTQLAVKYLDPDKGECRLDSILRVHISDEALDGAMLRLNSGRRPKMKAVKVEDAILYGNGLNGVEAYYSHFPVGIPEEFRNLGFGAKCYRMLMGRLGAYLLSGNNKNHTSTPSAIRVHRSLDHVEGTGKEGAVYIVTYGEGGDSDTAERLLGSYMEHAEGFLTDRRLESLIDSYASWYNGEGGFDKGIGILYPYLQVIFDREPFGDKWNMRGFGVKDALGGKFDPDLQGKIIRAVGSRYAGMGDIALDTDFLSSSYMDLASGYVREYEPFEWKKQGKGRQIPYRDLLTAMSELKKDGFHVEIDKSRSAKSGSDYSKLVFMVRTDDYDGIYERLEAELFG